MPSSTAQRRIRAVFASDSPMTLGLQFLIGHILAGSDDVDSVDVLGLLVGHSDYTRIETPFTAAEAEHLDRFLTSRPVDVFGISTIERTRPRLLGRIRRLREQLPETLFLAGGVDASSDPESYLSEGVDLVAIGDGEEPVEGLLRRLAKGEPSDRIATDPPSGFASRAGIRDATPAVTPPQLPLPYYGRRLYRLSPEGFVPAGDPQPQPGHVQFCMRRAAIDAYTQRGCTHECSFCAQDLLHVYQGDGFRNSRRRPLIEVIAHLRQTLHAESHRDYVYFWDLDFLRRSREELRQFADSYRGEVGLPFFIFVTEKSVNAAGEEVIRSLAEAGMATINMGLQSGSDRVLQQVYQRKNTSEEARLAIQIIDAATRDFPIEILYDIITYSPEETPDDIRASIRLIEEVPTGGRQSIRLSSHRLSYNTGQELSMNSDVHTNVDYQDFISTRALSRHTQSPYLAWLLGQMLRGPITPAAVGSVRRESISALVEDSLVRQMEKSSRVMEVFTNAFLPRENESFLGGERNGFHGV